MDVSCLLPEARQKALGLLGARAIKRARRLFLVLALVTALVEIAALAIGHHDATLPARIAPIAGLVALWAWWRQSCHEQRMPAWRDPVEIALVTGIGLTAGATTTFALLVVGVLFRSLFTGPVRTALGVAGYLGAHLAAIAFGPATELTLADGLRAAPLLALAGGIMFVFGRSLERYDTLQSEVVEARAERRLAAIVRHSADIVTVMDGDRIIRYQSPSIQQLGYAEGELIGTSAMELPHPDDVEWVTRAFWAAAAARALDPEAPVEPIECRWRHRDGTYRLTEHVATNMLDDPDVQGIVLTTRDITQRRALEDELKHRAFHDVLTGLPNRARLEDRLIQRLAAARAGGLQPGLVLLDLDDFKQVNDSLGHAAGDALLVAMSRRLSEFVRDPDCIARLGGDEFAVLLHAPAGEDDADDRAGALLEALSLPFEVSGRSLRVAASAGVALALPGDGPEELLRNADLALYASKAAGKGRVARYRPEMHDAALDALELEGDLRAALSGGALELHFQPLVNAGREIAGLEALLRWRHPQRGLLTPAAFLGIAERSGLIVPMGRWVLREACARAAAWDARHPELGAVGIGVNVSAEQLREPSLVDDVRRALQDSGLPPGRLILEITETAMMRDLGAAATSLERIKALGVRIALDDFGTGYSSLSYLQQLPLDFLKIPRPFVAALDDTGDERAVELVRGIVTLGRTLGLRVVAEGVETERQRAAVHALGCDLVQGFLLARPMPPCEVDALLAGRASGPATASVAA